MAGKYDIFDIGVKKVLDKCELFYILYGMKREGLEMRYGKFRFASRFGRLEYLKSIKDRVLYYRESIVYENDEVDDLWDGENESDYFVKYGMGIINV